MLGQTMENQDSYVDILSNLNVNVPNLDKSSSLNSQSNYATDAKNQTLVNFNTPFFGGNKQSLIPPNDDLPDIGQGSSSGYHNSKSNT